MKNIIYLSTLIFSLILSSTSIAQQKEHPVKWVVTVEQTKEDSATLIFTAIIEKGWHIYSQFTPDGGPIATAFTYPKPSTPALPYALVGKTTEPKADEAFDKDFGVKVMTLQGAPIFRQQLAIKGKKKISIPIKIDYEACKDRCLFLDTSFVMTIIPKTK